MLLVLVTGCASSDSAPPAHVVTGVEDRVRQRVNRIELVVDDAERAEKVTGVYLELEKLIIGYRRSLERDNETLWQVEADPATDEAVIREMLAAARSNADQTWEQYAALQMQLRELLSRDEFEKIDALR
jgi:hypothetical protein